jgi:hypothetical protein
MASKYMSMFTQSRCGEMAELTWHPKGIGEKEWFWLKEDRKRG